MDTSTVSIYENVNLDVVNNIDKYENEAINLVVLDILKVVQSDSPVNYCPFCISSFCVKNLLQEHLISLHYAFLWELTGRTVNLQLCPLCPGKMAGHHLVAKHSLSYHGQVIVDTYFPKCNASLICIFCKSSIKSRYMPRHIEETHTLEFVEWFKENFQLKVDSISGLVANNDSINLQESIHDLDEINRQLSKLKMLSPTKSPKSILKKQDARRKINKLSVRRVLRFSDDKENLTKSVFTRSEAKITGCPRRNSLDNSWGAVLRDSRFRCGKCSIYFSNHSQLTLHIKKEHKSLSFKPFYECGVCAAKFFKSSYLKKHSHLHSLKHMR